MPSTYSPDLRIELIANGEQSGYWGTTTNNNLGTLIEEAIAKTVTVTLTSTKSWFTATNGASDEARCAAAIVGVDGTITTGFTAYIPPVPKLYVVKNNSSYTMTLRNATAVNGSTSAGGTTVVIPTGKTVAVRSDGTNCYSQFDYVPNDLQISGSLTIGGATTFTGDLTIGNRLSGTYTQTATTVTVTASSHGYTNGESVAFINASGLGQSGTYTITYINANSFSFTSAVSQSTSGSCYVTNDFITANGVFDPGVVIEGSSTIPTLRVTQTGSGDALRIDDSANPDTSPFIVDAGGRVLVGVENTLPAGLIYPVEISNTSTSGIGIARFSADSSSPVIAFGKSRNTTNGTLGAIVVSDDNLGEISFFGDDGDALIRAARITSEVDGTPGNNDMPGRLVFSTTADGASSVTERLRINNAGNVIIGSGEASATTTGNTLRAPNRTGTDVAGTNLTIQAGNGTGTGGSGYLSLQTANVGSSGTTANTMVDRLKVQTNGLLLGQYSTMGAGVVPSESFYRLQSDFTGTASTTDPQSLFGVGITLAANTVYAFEMVFAMVKTATATSHTLSLVYDIGSGTISDIDYQVLGLFVANSTAITNLTAPDAFSYIQTAAATAITAASGGYANAYYIGRVVGTVSIGTSGKFTPQYKTSANVGAYNTKAGSFIRLYPLGAAGSNINVGGWA